MPSFFRTENQKRIIKGGLALFRLRPYSKKQIWATADFTKWALPLSLCLIFCLLFTPAFAIDSQIYTSADGKIKLVIPEGALNNNKARLSAALPEARITIETITRQGFPAAAFPKDSQFLIGADFKPDDLFFKKEAVLIITLPEAQVPGTRIQLYYYSPGAKRFIAEGLPASVAKDSYTVSFKIRHFSGYAAFKNLIPTSAPIGAGVKIPLPDLLTGSFSHSVPLTIPPGRKGMQPSLSLNYRSSNSNSWTGLGWSLNPGYIVRSTRLGPPSYDDQKDTFYFITDAGTTELVWLIDNLYQAKIESSFAKFFKESNDSWRVLGKDGSQLFFGQSGESKETSPFGTFSWYLTKAIDNNNNYIIYTYIKDLGKSYLSRIDYTGNDATGTSPTNSVELFTESREDILSSYISSAKISTSRRLNRIETRVDTDPVWVYKLDYGLSPDTNRSLLKSVTQFDAKEEKSFPAQEFEYQAAK